VISTSFKAEKTLTKDTVPVDVDAVLFWKVLNPQKAALEVADYNSAINRASQTALRDVIGKSTNILNLGYYRQFGGSQGRPDPRRPGKRHLHARPG
jgi:regulator of protease activity HflC (stomatin/prohibitin superfamily)